MKAKVKAPAPQELGLFVYQKIDVMKKKSSNRKRTNGRKVQYIPVVKTKVFKIDGKKKSIDVNSIIKVEHPTIKDQLGSTKNKTARAFLARGLNSHAPTRNPNGKPKGMSRADWEASNA